MSPHFKMVVYLSLGLLLVFGWHFATVFGYLGPAADTKLKFFGRIGIIFFLFMLASTIVAVIIARRHNDTAPLPDEREEQIELRSERIGIVTLYLGLLVVCWFGFNPMTPIQVANAILAAVCVSELAKICYGLYKMNRPL